MSQRCQTSMCPPLRGSTTSRFSRDAARGRNDSIRLVPMNPEPPVTSTLLLSSSRRSDAIARRVPRWPDLPHTDLLGRVATHHREGSNILHQHRAGGGDGVMPHPYSRPDEYPSRNPAPVLDYSRPVLEVHDGAGDVVAGRGDVDVVGERDVAPHRYGLQVEDLGALPNPAVIAHPQFPREMDIDTGLHVEALPHLGAEDHQQPSLEARRPGKGGEEEEPLAQIPGRKRRPRAPSIMTDRGIEQIESDLAFQPLRRYWSRR